MLANSRLFRTSFFHRCMRQADHKIGLENLIVIASGGMPDFVLLSYCLMRIILPVSLL
jgi:hypothetical protein